MAVQGASYCCRMPIAVANSAKVFISRSICSRAAVGPSPMGSALSAAKCARMNGSAITLLHMSAICSISGRGMLHDPTRKRARSRQLPPFGFEAGSAKSKQKAPRKRGAARLFILSYINEQTLYSV